VAALRARLDEALGRVRHAAPLPPGADDDGVASDGDPAGPLPADRGALVALIDARIAEKVPLQAAREPGPRKPRRSIEEAGAEIGLNAFEIDAARAAYQAAEMEMITAVMGTSDLDAVKEEVRAARDDPDRKAALVQKAVGNVIRNLGRVVTIEDRRDRDLRRILSEEQVKRLKGYDLKPTAADAELEDILEEAFGGR